jgi:hypothetical protein
MQKFQTVWKENESSLYRRRTGNPGHVNIVIKSSFNYLITKYLKTLIINLCSNLVSAPHYLHWNSGTKLRIQDIWNTYFDGERITQTVLTMFLNQNL